MTLQILVFVVTALAGLLTVSRGCSPPAGYRAPTLDWKMMNSDVVALGTPLLKVNDHRFPSDVFRVQFEIQCIYKGGPLNELIWIEKAGGAVPGNCHDTGLDVGEKYLVYLRIQNSSQYFQNFTSDPGSPEYVEEIVVLCETKMTYPIGYNTTNNKGTCLVEQGLEDCLPAPVITNPPDLIIKPDVTNPPDLIIKPDVTNPPAVETDQDSEEEDTDVSEPVAALDQNMSEEDYNGSVALTLTLSVLSSLVLCVLLL